jgi:hypothetical protein
VYGGGVCVGEAVAYSTTPTYTTGNDSPAREPSWLAFWLQKPSILSVCVREEDVGGREEVVTSDLKMWLENGRADERVSRGQASERAVCVCELVSVEKGTRRPPLLAVCVCLLLQDLVQSCLRGGGGGYWRTCATRDDEPRPVWTRDQSAHHTH